MGWRPLFLSVCACCAYSMAIWAGAFSSYRLCLLRLFSGPLGWRVLFLSFVFAVPALWPFGLAPCLLIRLSLLRLFSGPLAVHSWCAYSLALRWFPVLCWLCASLTLWADALSSYPFLVAAPSLWPSGLVPSLPVLCWLLASLALWLAPHVLSFRVCCAYSSWLAPALRILLVALTLFSGDLGWRPIFLLQDLLVLSTCDCWASSLAL